MAWQRQKRPDSRAYDICLSFAGEQRPYVKEVAERLESLGVRVFFDEFERANLWGKDLYERLDWVYSKAARHCILFASQDYMAKMWTTHERKSAQERALRESQEYILPVIFDDTEIPGIRSTTGYLDARVVTAHEVAGLAREKLGAFVKYNYLPPKPVRLFKVLRLTSEPQQHRAQEVAQSFLDTLERCTVEERQLIVYMLSQQCPVNATTRPHVVLDILRRDVGVGRSELMSAMHGLSSLGFEAEILTHGEGQEVEEAINIRWRDPRAYRNANTSRFAARRSTEVAAAMVRETATHFCGEHQDELAASLDFSFLAQEDPSYEHTLVIRDPTDPLLQE